MNFLKGKKNLIKVEVILGFSIVLALLATAGIINFYSLNKLVKAVTTISREDKVLVCLRQISNQLSDEEKAMRSYTVSKDVKYLNAYEKTTDSLHLAVGHLKLYTISNEKQTSMADSISNYVAAREGLYGSYIEKRKESLDQQLNNSKYTLPETGDKNRKATGRAIAGMDSTKTAKKGGIAGFFKNVFGGDKGDKNNTGDEKKTTPENKSYHSQEVNAILAQQLADIQQQWQSWSLDELLLLQRDKVLMDELRKSISNLEGNEMSIVRRQADTANIEATGSVKMIGIISALCLVCILIFIYLILTDITKSNRLKTQLIEERRKAEKLAKVKEEFLANMSHEIRTPLNAIIGFTEQILKEDHDEKQNRFIRAIERSSDHLLSIVNQILDYSRLEAGKVQQADTTFCFGDAIREVYELFRIKSSAKNVWLGCHVDEGIPKYIQGDMVGYKQILINLINNAVKFTEKGSVEIKCTLDRTEQKVAYIKAEVIDTGPGIPYEMQGKIFDEFTQGDAEITRKYGGTGLGLAITRKLVKLLNGSIGVKSRVNEGTIFYVIIPFKISENVAPVQEGEKSRLQPRFFNKCVLIVDDEEMNLLLGKTILENWNITTQTAINAGDAIEKFNMQHFDLILLDIQMPEISGLELAKMIRNMNSNHAKTIPIIALTANVHNDFSLEGNGINDILIKPFKEKDLQDKLTKFWDNNLNPPLDNIKEINNGKPKAETAALSYDLSFLSNTSGATPEFVKHMVQSFIQNNWNNIVSLNKALNENDFGFIQRHAHKMIPSYRYLQINKTTGELKMLEKLAEERKELNKISELISIITEDTHHIINLLGDEVDKLGFHNDKPEQKNLSV